MDQSLIVDDYRLTILLSALVLGVSIFAWPALPMNRAQVAIKRALVISGPLQERGLESTGSTHHPILQDKLSRVRLAIVQADLKRASSLADRFPKGGFAYRSSHELIARAYWDMGNKTAAIDHWQMARANLELHEVGLQAFDQGELDLAILAWEAAFSNWRRDGFTSWAEEKAAGEAHGRLATIYSRRGNLARAIYEYEQRFALKEYGENPNDYAKVAELYRHLGDFHQAQTWLDRAFSIDRRNAFLFYNQGRLLADQGDTEEAIVSYNQALEYVERDNLRTAILQALDELQSE